MVSFNGKKIIYTFKYGKSFDNMKKGDVIFVIVSCVAFILLGLAGFTVMFLKNNENAWTGFIFCGIGTAILSVLLIWFLSKRKREKEILKWLADEKLFESKGYPWEVSSNGDLIAPACSFGIDFKRDGKSYRKICKRQDGFFKKVEGTKITVLYSPEYDEVMVLETSE